jgi:mutator protein MutT
MIEEITRFQIPVKAFIKKDNKILLTSDRDRPNRWELPGGRISKGQQPKETLKRELKEELGIKLNEAHLLEAFAWTPDKDSKGDPGSYYLTLVYEVNLQDQEIKPGFEIGVARWFTPEEIQELMIEANSRHFLQKKRES